MYILKESFWVMVLVRQFKSFFFRVLGKCVIEVQIFVSRAHMPIPAIINFDSPLFYTAVHACTAAV